MKKSKLFAVSVICLFSLAWGVSTLADAPDTKPDALQAELLSVAPQLPAYTISDRFPIAWENSNHPERTLWSEYAYSVINQYFDQLDQAEDTPDFCRNYKALDRDQKITVWTQIFAGISYWETGWDPLNRTLEGPDLDEITGEKPVSEGLLQLSYADMNNYQDLETGASYCTFTWDKDRILPVSDIHRSILNPYNNLYCGIRIMADSIVSNHSKDGKKRVVYNGYWSTLGAGFHMHNRASDIRRAVQKFPFCGRAPIISPADLFLKGINRIQKAIKRGRE